MKTKGIKYLYLPHRISTHAKIFLFCAIFAPLWGLFIRVEINWSFLIWTFLVVFTSIEIIFSLSKKIFEYKADYARKGITQKEITRIYLFRLVYFYIIALTVIILVFTLFLIVNQLMHGYGFPYLAWIFHEVKDSVKVAAIGLLVSLPVFFFVPWQESMKREFDLREQFLIFQNETLKSQVNPHFLFNSLNTLSSLVSTETDIANRFIGKLAMIYRYILDNSSKVKVPLKDELAFIEDYFYLHKIRSEGKIMLHFDAKDVPNYEILPVSLQLLIENAIKHNMATLEKPLKIDIYIEGDNIVVKNNLQKLATQVVSTKIGLKNLGERIRLVTGKEINIEETSDEFIVKVPLIS